jgi:hypothetical protein
MHFCKHKLTIGGKLHLQALAASMAGPSPRSLPVQSALLPGQQQAASSNGTAGVGPAAGDLSNVRVDPLGRPTSIDKEHQVSCFFTPILLAHNLLAALVGVGER